MSKEEAATLQKNRTELQHRIIDRSYPTITEALIMHCINMAGKSAEQVFTVHTLFSFSATAVYKD